MFLELMKGMMPGVRICCFIGGYEKKGLGASFFFFGVRVGGWHFLHLERDIDHLL